MASHKSALKKEHQDRRRRARNRSHLTRLKTELKRIRGVIARGSAEEAAKALPEAESILDRTATLGVIHRNAASRTKSRIARQVAKLRSV